MKIVLTYMEDDGKPQIYESYEYTNIYMSTVNPKDDAKEDKHFPNQRKVFFVILTEDGNKALKWPTQVFPTLRHEGYLDQARITSVIYLRSSQDAEEVH